MPVTWPSYITHAKLTNEKIDIDVEITAGLNVVIGESSAGKSLFVDSIYRKARNSFANSVYESTYQVSGLDLTNPFGTIPHYIRQTHITKLVDNNNKDDTFDNFAIIRRLFPEDDEVERKIFSELIGFREVLKQLVYSTKQLKDIEDQLGKIPKLSKLILDENIKENVLSKMLPAQPSILKWNYTQFKYERDVSNLDRIENFLRNNPLIEHNSDLIRSIKIEIETAKNYSQKEAEIRETIEKFKEDIDKCLLNQNSINQSRIQEFEKLLELVARYITEYHSFKQSLDVIANYHIDAVSKEIYCEEHKLFIENRFALDKDKFLEIVNEHLKETIDAFDKISPEDFYASNFKKRPKIGSHEDFELKVYQKFEQLNKRTYKIKTKDGKDYDSLSAGWKTSIILDLILSNDQDNAPLIVDQPEDNLATHYINTDLISAIKKIKTRKQIILVTHNATIPMLGDAQNVILCQLKNNKIDIKSARLEDAIDGVSMTDHIAKITDGGKSSIKKRFKKYNIRKFKEESDAV
jgi:DNA repair ATPase RecN